MAYGFNEDKTLAEVASVETKIFKSKTYTLDVTFTNYYYSLALDTPTGYTPFCVKQFGANNPINAQTVLNIVGLRFTDNNTLIINSSSNVRRPITVTVIFIKTEWLSI